MVRTRLRGIHKRGSSDNEAPAQKSCKASWILCRWRGENSCV